MATGSALEDGESYGSIAPRRRMLLADDHAGIRAALRALFDGEYKIVGEVGDGISLLDAARQLHPDVILMDLSMPGMNGIDAAARLRALAPETKLIMLSAHADRNRAAAAFSAGVVAYILKGDPGRLPGIVRKVVEQGEPGKHCFLSC